MRKSDLLELILEINQIPLEEQPIVVGSQAVYSVTDRLLEIAQRLIECDFLFIQGNSETLAEINKRFGVFSDFQIEHAFYADALGKATVVLP